MNAAADPEWDLLQADARACRVLFPGVPCPRVPADDIAAADRRGAAHQRARAPQAEIHELIGADWAARVLDCSGLGC